MMYTHWRLVVKRSDIVDIIHDYTSTLGIKNHDLTIADHIVELVEKAGMLPPIEKGAEQYKTLCKWEPEDS